MTKTMNKQHTEESINNLIGLIERFKQNGDWERVDKAKKLLKKRIDHEFIIAFCGHFSAGKSTMINSLLGDNVLPTSPIPTSANLVKVHKAANDYATVFYHDQSQLLFQAPYDFKKVKEFCKNGDVSEIEIGQATSDLAEGVTVMDTPGVDSTDDAHRISTESAIHLADIVFYVMDYNHVQSELNFMYTKDLLRNGVELYLIINQIDKHNDEELSFNDFQKSVKESFASWDVHPNGIFYTTLKKPEDPKNQFQTVKHLIQNTMNEKEERILTSTESSVHILVQEHFKWLKEEQEEKAKQYEEIVNQYPVEKRSTIFEDEENMVAQMDVLHTREEKWKQTFNNELDKILTNAYLMPFQTRELAESYLESVQSDFKVGFFGKKTELVRRERLDAFYKNLTTQVDTQLTWHLRQFAINQLKETKIVSDELQRRAQQLSIDFDATLITNSVKPGARLTGEYVLNYCDEITETIRKQARTTCQSFREDLWKTLKPEIESQYTTLESSLRKIKKVTNALRVLDQLESERNQKEENVYLPVSNVEESYRSLRNEWENNEKKIRIYSPENEKDVEKNIKSEKITETKKDNMSINTSLSVDSMIEKLKKAVFLLKDKKGFQRVTDVLAAKSERLENREYTIALFGAFSAGKSSFANALLGEKVLPVSPNPTTAAIKRICPPTSEYKHGTAIVHLKSNQHVLEDVQKSLKFFGTNCDRLHDAENIIHKVIQSASGSDKEKIHLSFLNAFLLGFPKYKEKLGEDIVTDLHDFRGFVANESQSCFVESIDLYYDSELAQKGITLVDTPGADSINARHTGVAFEYIKNSDAILFVTYYNHAFSKADREFLIQLGRVKDAFELDKMFFIINAIDLANSEEELSEVQSYVHDQLTQYGIRFPRIFGVSSLLALSEDENTSRINLFKNEFNHFLETDLMKMTIQSAETEYQKGIQILDSYIATALEGKEEKENKKQELLKQKEKVHSLLTSSSSDFVVNKFSQEQKELLFYVKQRVFYRFPDFFKEAFNPAVIQKNNKGALNIALDDLLDSIGYDFSQELRATSLRLENIVKEAFAQQIHQLSEQIAKIQKDIQFSNFECNRMTTPTFPNAFEKVSKVSLEKSFKHFKNAKSFFEKNEKQLMQEELEELLRPLADEYIDQQGALIQQSFTIFIEQQFSRMIEEMLQDTIEQFNGWFEILDEHIDVNEWVEIRNQLAK
ncbi:dynamin family protein [Heyndrickxia sporothermodurans]|uniref:dynamin family protein n=1 Tax=Heyndrickxia sporothermodurans TaxID=46224 RepID=UPI00192CCA3D|nr:dynamin family protein [Heyndrickxia sporothermodurans]MBL5830656.1 dynamin family protein [Heyndrickxia sporothermodurans]